MEYSYHTVSAVLRYIHLAKYITDIYIYIYIYIYVYMYIYAYIYIYTISSAIYKNVDF